MRAKPRERFTWSQSQRVPDGWSPSVPTRVVSGQKARDASSGAQWVPRRSLSEACASPGGEPQYSHLASDFAAVRGQGDRQAAVSPR